MIFDSIINLKDSFKKQEPITLNMDEASAKSIIDQYNDMKISADAFIERTGLSDEAMQSYLHTVESGNATFSGCTQYVNSASNSIGLMGIKAKATTVLMKGLKAAAGMLGTMLISMAVGKLIEGFDNLIHKSEKIAEAAETAKQKIDELNNIFEKSKNTVNDIKERYAKLAQGVDLNTNVNLTLSNNDYEEFLDLNNQLAELFPTLTKNYDNNGNAILDLSGNINNIVASLDDLIERQRQLTNEEILGNLPEIYDNYESKVSKYEKQLDNAKKKQEDYLKLYNQLKYAEYDVSDDKKAVTFHFGNINEEEKTKLAQELADSFDDLNDYVVQDLGTLGNHDTTITLYLDKEFSGFEARLRSAQDEIIKYTSKIESEVSSFSSYINTWLQGNWLYQQQDDEMQKALQQVLFNKDWISEAKSELGNNAEWKDVSKWIEEEYINAINNINNEEIKQDFVDLFTLDLTPQATIDLAQKLQEYFNENDILVSLDFILDEENPSSMTNLVNRVTERNRQLTGSLDELKKKYEEVKDARKEAYSGSNYVGNVDINNRPIVTDSNLGGDYQTSYTGFQEYQNEDGFYEIVHFTPILPDGTVLDDNTLYEYLDNVIATSQNKLEADKVENGGLGILYKVDTTVGGKKITDNNLDNAFKQADQWDVQMHEQQADIYDEEASALIDYNKALEEQNKLNQYFKDNSIDTEEEYNIWLQVTAGAENATDAIKKYEEYLNSVSDENIEFFTEENLDSIDTYKSKISDLSSYLQSINDNQELSADEISTLNTGYGIVANSVEEYKQKIIDLMNETANSSDVMIVLAEAIDSCTDTSKKERLQSLYDSLYNFNIEAQESVDNLYNLEGAMSKLESAASLLRDVDESINNNGFIDSSQLSKILSVYPQLADEIAAYNAGLIDSQELFKELTKAYEVDQKKYATAVANKLKNNDEFFNGVIEKLPDWVKDLAEAYNIDFKNYKSLVEAKLKLEKELAEKRNVLQSATAIGEKIAENQTPENSFGKDIMGLHAQNNIKNLKKDYSKTKQELDAYGKIIKEVDAAFTTTLDLDTSWQSFGKDPSSDNDSNGSGSDNDFSNEIDWIENSLSNVNREIDSINEKIGNAKGFKKRLSLYEDLNEANQKLVDATGKAADAYGKEWIKASNKISSEYKNKIISGNTFAVEEFNNETLYNNVNAAKDAYEQWQSSIQRYNQALAQQKEDHDSYTEILLEQAEIKLDIISLDIEEADTANQKNKLLNREKELKKQILEYNLSLAESEEEKLRLQKEYNKEIAENNKQQYDNKRQEISNKVGYYDSYIQDIQNAIELAEASGGQGTALQYKEMNNYLGRQIELEKINYENALKKRDGAVWGSDEWNQYNDEIQEAQDKIHACTLAQLENNRAILLLPVQKYEKANEELQEQLDTLNEYQSKIENAIGYASTLIQDQIDILNENKENISDYWDDQIEAVQKEKDALTESNDELQRQINLENAKYNLEKAMNNKTSRVYRKGEGFVYEADQNAIRDAQEELDNLEYDNAVNNLDKTIEALEKQKEDAITVIDEQIESWEKYAEKIDRVTNSYENFMAMQDLIQVFGSTAIADILNKDEEIISNFELTLNSVKTDVDEIQQKIEANERLISSIQQEAEAFTSSSNNIVEAKNNIKQAIIENEEEISAIEKRRDIAKELSTTWTSTKDNIASALGNIDELNISSKDSEFETLSERIKNLQDFETKATNIYSNIVKILNKAKSAMQSLNGLNDKANGTSSPSGSSNPNKTDLPNYHTGGIVGKDITSKELPEHLISLVSHPLKPNETLAKLLNGEVVLNNNQMGNLFDNLSNVLSPLASNVITKQTDTSMNISIGDVNVYNPDNSDMIVNEIVKELPLKVIQKLNSK